MDDLKVLRIDQFAGDNPEFYVNTISSHLATSHMHVNKPHKHNFYATFLFTKGSGVHEIDFNSYQVCPFSVFLLSPGQTHAWQLSDDVEGIIFFHSREFYHSHYLHDQLEDFTFFSHLGQRAAIYLAGPERDLASLFEKLLAAKKQDFPKRKQLLLSLITQIYVGLEHASADGNLADNAGHSGYYLKFLKFTQLVEEHFRSEKSARRYAQWMNITPKHLNRINKTILNKTTSEIIADRVMLEARRDLIYGKKNFSEIADSLGFGEYAHFSKMFKHKTGQTPSEFAKSYG